MIHIRLAAFVAAVSLIAVPLYPLAEAAEQNKPAPCAGENVEAIGKQWQKKLRLEDWRIAYICGMPASKRKTNYGVSATSADTREALVLINPEITNREFVREVVLHELLHILLFEAKLAQSQQVDEQVVRAVSEAILCSERPKRNDCDRPTKIDTKALGLD